jgi:predicted AAA+ superfamily ATPase
MRGISRPRYTTAIKTALGRTPICALLGPRQCGKTTLARIIARETGAAYFDLESAPDRARLESPLAALDPLEGIVVLDEIQRRPELFEHLRVLADRDPLSARFLILGSASPELVRQASESLAGRIEFVDLAGFDVSEVGAENLERRWVRGGFPRSYLAETDDDSFAWRANFIRTFLERDIPQLGIRIPSAAIERFWTMVSHYHGQIWNASELAASLGLSDKTITQYLDILCGTYMMRRLQPWHENLRKRQVKSPKVYIRDSGIFHSLIGLPDRDAVLGHPKLGASWEGFMLEQVLRHLDATGTYFWATHAGAELDLLVMLNGRRYGIEFKWHDAPRMTRSLHVALEDLHLERACIIYPGKEAYAVHEKVTAVPATSVERIGKVLLAAHD